MVTRSTLVWALRSTWWLPEALVMISTPSRPMSTWGLWREAGGVTDRLLLPLTYLSGGASMVEDMTSGGCKALALPLASPGWGMDGTEPADLRGVQSSSQISLPTQVSWVARTTSPKGTVFCSGEKEKDHFRSQGHLHTGLISRRLTYCSRPKAFLPHCGCAPP